MKGIIDSHAGSIPTHWPQPNERRNKMNLLPCPICKKKENPQKTIKIIYKALGGTWCIWHFCRCGMSIFSGSHKSKKDAIAFWNRWAK